MATTHQLSAFDRIGVIVVTVLGSCIGWMTTTTSDAKLTPMLALIVPGFAIAVGVAKVVGVAAAVFVSIIANGTIYGLLLYGWDRLANMLNVDCVSSEDCAQIYRIHAELVRYFLSLGAVR